MGFEAYSSRLLSLHEFCGQDPKKFNKKGFKFLTIKCK